MDVMEIVTTVAVLTPVIVLFLLALAVTVHFFWLSHQGRWPPYLPPDEGERQPGRRAPAEPRGRSARARLG